MKWDLRALEAAQALSNDRAIDGGGPGGARSLCPSVHLNLAECYRKLGDSGLARHHLQKGRATLEGLDPDGYLDVVREALDRLDDALE